MLSENIKTLRKQKGYSQEQLADKLNVVRQTISKWEKGYSVPDADMLEELADIFEVSVGDLLGKEILTEEETTDIAELIKQLTILNECFSEKNRKRKKVKRIIKKFCGAICIVGIIFCMYLGVGTLISQGQEIFRDETKITLVGAVEDKEYRVQIEYWNLGNEIHVVNWSNTIPKPVKKILEDREIFTKEPEKVVEEIKTYFIKNGGTCEIKYEDLNAIKKIIELIKIETTL